MAAEIFQVPIDPEKMNQLARRVDEADTQKWPCVPTDRVYIPSSCFVVFREIAKMIIRGTAWNKKARIVLEYDPQDAKMSIVTFMEPDAAHSRERDEI